MGGCMGVDRLVVPSDLVSCRNMSKKDGKDAPFCSRIGCSAKVTSTKRAWIGSTNNKKKVGWDPVSTASHGKEIVGSSSRTPNGFGYIRKLVKGSARRQTTDMTSIHDAEPTIPRQKTKRGAINVHSQSYVSGEAVMTMAGSSSKRASRNNLQRPDLGTRDALTDLSVSPSSDNNEHTVRGGVTRNFVSDVLPNNSNLATKFSETRMKNFDGESSSSSNCSKTNVSVPKERNQITSHGNGITVSDNRRMQIIRDNNVGRLERLGAVASSATSLQAPTDTNRSPSCSPSNSYSRPNSSTGSPLEADPSLSLVNQDCFSRYNMNGIAEVLLALQRIERDEELMYEQLASLETNLLAGGMLSFYDQHRDMRLDIDNMSYEELLSLGDEMGTVSTALSEESLSRSLKKSIYEEKDETGVVSLNKDDTKCSICQEEYGYGDEVGTMPCQHMYHVRCVQQWLRMKNWCPVCKTSVKEDK
ncbi:unnamed protein product [Cochlearia groenlandica]